MRARKGLLEAVMPETNLRRGVVDSSTENHGDTKSVHKGVGISKFCAQFMCTQCMSIH